MKQMNNKFEPISCEKRKEITEDFYKKVKEDYCKGEIQNGYYRYESVIQGVKFRTHMTDEELKSCISLTVDLIEEFKVINSSGKDGAAIKKFEEEIEGIDETLGTFRRYLEIASDNIHIIVYKIDETRRVGGAYAALIANPLLYSAIYAVYEKLVDNFDDDEFYWHSAYFLLRAIMKMRSEEIDV